MVDETARRRTLDAEQKKGWDQPPPNMKYTSEAQGEFVRLTLTALGEHYRGTPLTQCPDPYKFRVFNPDHPLWEQVCKVDPAGTRKFDIDGTKDRIALITGYGCLPELKGPMIHFCTVAEQSKGVTQYVERIVVAGVGNILKKLPVGFRGIPDGIQEKTGRLVDDRVKMARHWPRGIVDLGTIKEAVEKKYGPGWEIDPKTFAPSR